MHTLDALLNLDGGVKPEMVATDKILGYDFSPRFKDLDDQRFSRATMPGVETGTYGVLEPLARNRVTRGARLRWVRRSRSTGGSPGPSTCRGWSTRSMTPTPGR
ncbi:Tn3 family transposase [Streptomyces triculaminicus]|uniref:Tn3 family transposase n=2 Tax=Streptomyces TaxID=1883 RepID=A0A939JRN2_9ACTN|nr:Tn3 family transposase [Streptomyces triculaminicus]QSY52713.1 Tn3 family transposase [Streptomyces griseocarneus]